MIRKFDGVNGLSHAYDIGYDDGYHQGMIRAYDDWGNVVDLVEWEANIRADAFDRGYDKGRADAINAIKNDLHKRLTEEMNNPYQDQSLCQGLLYGIQRCDWYLDDGKEQKQ